MRICYIVLHGKQNKSEEKNERVINGLKKYSRNMFILKVIVAILSIFIISVGGISIVKRVKDDRELKGNYEKGQYISSIVDKAYNTIDEITNSDNYSIVEERTTISYDFDFVYGYLRHEILYKDGYFKEVNTTDSGIMNLTTTIDSNYANYGVVEQEQAYCIQLREGNGYYYTSQYYQTNTPIHNVLGIYRKERASEYKDFEIREEKIDRGNYYVISKVGEADDGKYFDEIWINKDNMQVLKSTHEKIGGKKTETKFTVSINNVRDKDIKLSFASESEIIQEIDKLFEKVKNGEVKNYMQQAANLNLNNDSVKTFFGNYIKSNKKIIMQVEAMENIIDKYEITAEDEYEHSYFYKCIIFDQNGDAYYLYIQNEKNKFKQNIFVSIFGDIIKTNSIEKDFRNGELVIL